MSLPNIFVADIKIGDLKKKQKLSLVLFNVSYSNSLWLLPDISFSNILNVGLLM